MKIEPDLQCPLCGSREHAHYHQDRRTYLECQNCAMVFVKPEDRLPADEEKSRYDLHNNDPSDVNYRQFLSRLLIPLTKEISPGSKGLDFGSGPGPTLSIMLEEAGHEMNIFDIFYAPDASVFDEEYDFITASEVLEHLHQPIFELDRLWSCLKPNGWLGLMTNRLPEPDAFPNWYYKNDDTHVCFFDLESFRWLAKRWNARLVVASAEVVLLEKPD